MSSPLDNAIVHVSLGELKKLEEALAKAKARIVELEDQTPVRGLGSEQHVLDVADHLRISLRFALDALGSYVAACTPYETRGLPVTKLRELVTSLGAFHGEFADVIDNLTETSMEIEACEIKRAAKPRSVHVATGDDWKVGAEAFKKEFGVDPATYSDGGLAGVIKAQEAKIAELRKAEAQPQAVEPDPDEKP